MLTRQTANRRPPNPIRDGARELAAAIASLSSLVEVRLARRGFTTKPPNLFDLRFCDAGVGREQMPFLRTDLARRLPEIQEDLHDNAVLLDNPGHVILHYAEFLRTALAMRSKGLK